MGLKLSSTRRLMSPTIHATSDNYYHVLEVAWSPVEWAIIPASHLCPQTFLRQELELFFFSVCGGGLGALRQGLM